MIKITYLNPRMIIADEGKILTNGEVYSSVVYLGKDEDIAIWQEIDISDVPKTENEAEAVG